MEKIVKEYLECAECNGVGQKDFVYAVIRCEKCKGSGMVLTAALDKGCEIFENNKEK